MARRAISIKAFLFFLFVEVGGGCFCVFVAQDLRHVRDSVFAQGGAWGVVASLGCQAIYDFVWLRRKHMGSTAVANMQIWNERRRADPDVPLRC